MFAGLRSVTEDKVGDVDREQALAELAAYAEDDTGEPVFLPSEVFGQILSSELPSGVPVTIGTRRGNTIEVEWDGSFLRDEAGSLTATIEKQIWPKFWPEAVGARFYLDLLHKCVTAKLDSIDGLIVQGFDDSDDVMIRLEYSFPISAPNLGEAFNMARQVQDEIESPAERVLDDVTRTLAISAENVLQGRYARIDELMARVDQAESPEDKGSSLEVLMSALLEQVPGFTVYDRNVYTKTEEIDLVLLNGSTDPVYAKDGSLILVECKNWTGTPGRPEFSNLEIKVQNRGRRCTLAIFVSWSGFAGTVSLEQLRLSRGDYMIVCLAGSDIRRAALTGGFPELLRQATLDTATS